MTTKNLQTENVKSMSIKDLASIVFNFAQSNKEGFTLNINTLERVKTGFVASYKATQNSFSENDLQSVINHALSHDGIIGGWYNSENGRYYFDSSKVFNNLAKAIKFAVENEQLAIFDLDNFHEIRLDKQL